MYRLVSALVTMVGSLALPLRPRFEVRDAGQYIEFDLGRYAADKLRKGN